MLAKAKPCLAPMNDCSVESGIIVFSERGSSPTVREGVMLRGCALPYGRATAPLGEQQSRCSLIYPRIARGPGLPTAVNPEPLIRITPHVFLDDAGEQLGQAAHIFFIIARLFDRQRFVDLQQEAPALWIPGNEYRQHRSSGAQSELGQHESGRGRSAKKVDENSFPIPGV